MKCNLDRLRKTTQDFMAMTVAQIDARFKALPGAEAIPVPGASGDAVFVPGTRPEAAGRVLLVAHTDTVFKLPGKVRWTGAERTLAVSDRKGQGIGADNRAGVAALWELRDTGHPLLLVPDEEVGCVGSSFVAEYAPQVMDGVAFALQFDRRGSRDLVTYGCSNRSFDRYMRAAYPGYDQARGSFSDVAVLGPAGGIAITNVSIGFRDEHTSRESLDLLDFARTLTLTRDLLARETVERFEYREERVTTRFWDYDWGPKPVGRAESLYDLEADEDEEQEFFCSDCAGVYDEYEAEEDAEGRLLCPTCGVPGIPMPGPTDDGDEDERVYDDSFDEFVLKKYAR